MSDYYRSHDTSTDSDYAVVSEWADLPFNYPVDGSNSGVARDARALPGVPITDEVIESERQRRTLGVVLRRFAGERQITRATLRSALDFVGELPHAKVLPRVAPDGDGGVMLVWDTPGQGQTVITLADSMVYAVARAGTAHAHYFDDMPFDGVIEDELLDAIPG